MPVENFFIIFPKISYWIWLGTISLVYLTISDFKNKCVIDDRKNWLMYGLSISLISHIPTRFLQIIGIVLTIIIFNFFLNKYKLVGYGDISALSWILLGFGIIQYILILWFGVFIIILTLIDFAIKKWILRLTGHTPFFAVILCSFWLTSFIFRLY